MTMKTYKIIALLLIVLLLSSCTKTIEHTKEPIPSNSSDLEKICESDTFKFRENDNLNPVKINPYTPRKQIDDSFANDCYLRTGRELSVNYSTDLCLNPDALYLFNPNTNSIEKRFSDYMFPQTNSYVLPFSIQNQGVFTICNANSIVLFDKSGKKLETVYESTNGTIKDFLVDDSLIWVFCDNSIIRIDQKTGKCNNIYSGIEADDFCMFLYPISSIEIEWQEYGKEFWNSAQKEGYEKNNSVSPEQSDSFDSFLFQHSSLPVFVAYYYNCETETLITKDVFPLSETKTIGANWWLLNDDVFSTFEKYTYEIPSDFHLSGFDYTITTGGGKYINDYKRNDGNPVGFIAVDYELDIKRIINTRSDSKNSAVFHDIKDVQLYSDNLYTSTCAIMDYSMDETTREYYTAFLSMDNQPIFVFCLRADLYEKDEFLSICNTIHYHTLNMSD